MTELLTTRTIAVLGGGIAAMSAAVAFRRALPGSQVTVFQRVGAGPEYPGAAAPYIHEFHRLIGIQPELFRRRTGAVIVQEAEISRAEGPAFRFVPLADIPHADGAALHQLWLRRTAGDQAKGPEWADVARRARRAHDRDEGLGVRFDAGAYLVLLRELAAHLGVAAASEEAGRADAAAGHDLVIDACGLGDDWHRLKGVPGALQWQITDRGKAPPQAAEAVEFARRQVSWHNGAWHAAANLSDSMPAAGRVAAPWSDNVLAVGRAAAQCETCDGEPLAVALAGIARALEFIPRPGSPGPETGEYNRRTNAIHDYLLDWAAERWGSAAGRPAGRAALRAQFEHRGRIPFRDEDPVPAGHWTSWLLASGVRPRHIDLTAMAPAEEQLAALFAGF